MTVEIDQSSFRDWVNHPVTLELYSLLSVLSEDLEEAMLNPSMVLANDGQINYARALGNKELIDRILNLKLEDFKTTEEEHNVDRLDEKELEAKP